MTVAASNPAMGPGPSTTVADTGLLDRWPRLLVTIGLTYLVMMVVSAAQLYDPLVRHDDFSALLADPEGYYTKTLREGRWLNHFWHLRPWTTPAWVNFSVYQLFWCIFAGAAAVNAFGRSAKLWYVLALSMMIAISPPALAISLWFNTLIPGLGLVALFAVLSTQLSSAQTRALLLVFVPLTLMAYTTYPLFLLAICLTRHDLRNSWRDLIGLVGLFILAFALSILLIYTINWYAHGVFGIPMAEWRNPNPAHDLASAFANFHIFLQFIAESALAFSFNFLPMAIVQGIILLGGLVVLARSKPWIALYIATGMLAGLGLIATQILSTGIAVSVRASGFVWIFYAILCGHVALMLWQQRNWFWARMARNVMMLIIASSVLATGRQYYRALVWQDTTRSLAQQLETTTGPIYVIGYFKMLPGALPAGIQRPRGLRRRLQYLTGRDAFDCRERPNLCTDLPQDLLDAHRTADQGVEILQDGARTIILIPDLPKHLQEKT